MAENIVAGLFGLNPQMYGEQQRRSALQEGIDLAQLDPASRGAAMTYAGAKNLGGAIAGAMGIEDPQLKLISTRNTIAQQIDQTNPESILKGAQMLAQAGDQQGAMALAQYARQAQSEMALVQQRQAASQASLASASRERQQAVNPNIQVANEIGTLEASLLDIENAPDSPDRTRAKNLLNFRLTALKNLTTKPEKEKLSAFGQELVDAGLTPGTEPYIKRMNEYLEKKLEGVKKGTGNVTIGGINVDTGEAAKKAGAIIGTNVANIEQQFSLQTAYKDALGLLDKGIYGGAFGPEKQFVAKYTGVGSPEKVVNTEVFMANIGEIVIPRLQQFGGNDSNEELKYLQSVVAGNQRLEPESMKRTLISAEKKVQNNIKRLNLQAQAAKGGTELPITPVTNAPAITPTKRYNLQTRQLEVIKGD
jgi:hypothetical protein